MRLPVLANLLTTSLAAQAATSDAKPAQVASLAPGINDAHRAHVSLMNTDANGISAKGSRDFLMNLQGQPTCAVADTSTKRFFPEFSVSDAACRSLMASLENDLDADQKTRIADAVEGYRVVHKNTIPAMRRLLADFPTERGGLTDKESLEFHPAICTTVVSDKPLVATFNWKEQLFYGMVLNSENMKTVMSSNRNLWSNDCAYEVDKWTDRTPTEAGKKPEWHWRPVSNAAASGELCHDIDVATHMAARDIVLNEGEHEYVRDKELLTFNEVNVVKKSASDGPVCKGLFVDLVSNDFMYLLRKKKYRPLIFLSQTVPMDRWMKAVQTINFQFLKGREAEFQDARSLCLEQKLPFFMRSMDEQGVIGFKEVDLDEVRTMVALSSANPLLDQHSDPLLEPVVKILKAYIS